MIIYIISVWFRGNMKRWLSLMFSPLIPMKRQRAIVQVLLHLAQWVFLACFASGACDQLDWDALLYVLGLQGIITFLVAVELVCINRLLLWEGITCQLQPRWCSITNARRSSISSWERLKWCHLSIYHQSHPSHSSQSQQQRTALLEISLWRLGSWSLYLCSLLEKWPIETNF